MAESTSPSRLEVEFPACPVRFVVVYPDRAEVTREVKVQLVAGEHEIVLKGTSKALDKWVRFGNGLLLRGYEVVYSSN